MRNAIVSCTVLLAGWTSVWGLGATLSRADSPPVTSTEDDGEHEGRLVTTSPAPATPLPAGLQEGLWPSPKLRDMLISRWAEATADRYKLDDQQRAQVREAAVTRWGRFLDENRAVIQPIANEFIELRMDIKPPAKESVQAWAARARPVFARVRDELIVSTSEVRSVLSPLQRAKFELDAMQFGLGLKFAEGRLRRWEAGDFDPAEFWQPTRSERRRRRKERESQDEAHAAVEGNDAPKGAVLSSTKPPDQIELELTAWDKYVAEFVLLYQLDEGQRGSALSTLAELKGRAYAHRDRRRVDIAKLEQRIQDNHGTDEELADIKKKLTALYGPIDDMFTELQHRLDALPTAQQRENAHTKPEGTKRSPETKPK